MLLGIVKPGARQRMLVIDGYDRQAPVMPHVVGQRLEVRTNQFDLPLLAEPQSFLKLRAALGTVTRFLITVLRYRTSFLTYAKRSP